MKKKILLFLIISSFNVCFSQVSLEDCSNDAKDFLSQIAVSKKLNPHCYQLIESTRNHINESNSSDNFIEITGHKNILYTKVYGLDAQSNIILDAHRITAGHKTKLTNILAVDFLEDNAKIYVLNRDGKEYSLLNFIYDISGNINPARGFSSVELENATNLRADFDSKKIFVISSNDAWVKSFHLKADPRGKKPEDSTSMLTNISGTATELISPVDIVTNRKDVFILDTDRILVFNKNDTGSVAPKRVISGTKTKLSGSKRLEINNDGHLLITNGNETQVKFHISSNGNVAPLN